MSLRSQEPDLRADLDPVIRAALSDLYQYDLPQFGTEVNTLPRGQSRKPADNLYGSVLVEFKWNMGNALREKGSEQALDNLEKLENTASAEGWLTAVVCDGRQWGFLIERNPSALLAKPLRHSEHFEWRRNSVEATRRFLQICGDRWRIPLTGPALVKAFDGNADPTRAFIAILSVLLDSRQPDDRPDTLFREWSRSTEVAYGSLSTVPAKEHTELRQQFGIPAGSANLLSETLFIVHTYFAFVARVVAVEILSIARNEPADQPSGWASMDDKALRDALARLDRGSVPRGMLVSNLFEADVFSWWAPMADNETLDAVRVLLEQLGRFAFPSAAYGIQPSTDVLRELYLRLVPRSLRKRLGEYPTPPWLAEACLASLREEGIDLLSSTVLDPCCGTGSFILPLLKQRVADLRRRKGDNITSEDVQGVIDGLAGFDINPLAVVATRANFLVALGPLAQIGEFSLRIWRTDSIVLPDTQPSQTRMGDPRLYCSGYLELTTSLPDPRGVRQGGSNRRCPPGDRGFVAGRRWHAGGSGSPGGGIRPCRDRTLRRRAEMGGDQWNR